MTSTTHRPDGVAPEPSCLPRTTRRDEPAQRTIWLTSYPKSGNTWFRIMVANLFAKNDASIDINRLPNRAPAASARGPFERSLLIDSGLLTHDEIDCLRPRVYEELACGQDDDVEERDDPSPVRFVLVHDAYELTPKDEPLFAGRRGAAGAILIVRDPRDVAASLAHYGNVSIDNAIAFMNSRERDAHDDPHRLHKLFRQRPRGWSGHAQSWLSQTDIPVHLVRYEDMKADTAGTLARALDFAGLPASGDDIRRAVAAADFSTLQKQEQDNGFRELPWPQLGNRRFFRRGQAGAWRDELSSAQVARIETAHAAMMRRLGYTPAAVVPAARGPVGEHERSRDEHPC